MTSEQRPSGSLISFMSNMVKERSGINLAQGLPGFAPPPELIAILKDIAESDIHQYANGYGDSDILRLLAQKYQSYMEVTPENFLVSNGATEAVSLLYQYLNTILPRPFATLAFAPVYESYEHLPKLYGNPFIAFGLTVDGGIDFQQLRREIAANGVRVVFLCSPGNPLGKTWSREEMQQLLALADELDYYLIFDAVYQDLYFESAPYCPLAQFSPRMFYVNSFSKMLSITGWRVGYLLTTLEHRRQLAVIHDYTGLCAPSILQRAIAIYLEKYHLGQSYLADLRQRLHRSFGFMRNELSQIGFAIPPIDGGYFIWARLPERYPDGFQFALDLYREQKVAVVPGEHFSRDCANFVRINIAKPLDELQTAAQRIAAFCQV